MKNSNSKIYRSKYKDQNAVTIESDLIRAQFIPEIGSKMCSFIYKPRNLELLIQGKNKRYIIEPYDGTYTKGENSGFDEMFPTIIEPCTASFDRLDVAKLKGECSSVGPKSKYCWHLNLNVSEGEKR